MLQLFDNAPTLCTLRIKQGAKVYYPIKATKMNRINTMTYMSLSCYNTDSIQNFRDFFHEIIKEDTKYEVI